MHSTHGYAGRLDDSAYMFAVSYPEGTEAKDATDFFICYGSALRRVRKPIFLLWPSCLIIQKEEDKKLNLWIDGQPKIKPVSGVRKSL